MKTLSSMIETQTVPGYQQALQWAREQWLKDGGPDDVSFPDDFDAADVQHVLNAIGRVLCGRVERSAYIEGQTKALAEVQDMQTRGYDSKDLRNTLRHGEFILRYFAESELSQETAALDYPECPRQFATGQTVVLACRFSDIPEGDRGTVRGARYQLGLGWRYQVDLEQSGLREVDWSFLCSEPEAD